MRSTCGGQLPIIQGPRQNATRPGQALEFVFSEDAADLQPTDARPRQGTSTLGGRACGFKWAERKRKALVTEPLSSFKRRVEDVSAQRAI